MEIILEYPFNRYFRKGKLVINNENRKNVLLINYGSKVTTTSYARYLMSVHLKRFLKPNEHVDHKNNDKTDDRIDNYQILTNKNNNIKHAAEVIGGAKYYLLKCPVCGKEFERAQNQVDYKSTTTSVCSKKCAGIATHKADTRKKIILKEFRKITQDYYPILGYSNDDINDTDYVPDWVIRSLPDRNSLYFNLHKKLDEVNKNKCVVCLKPIVNDKMLYCSDQCHKDDPIRISL